MKRISSLAALLVLGVISFSFSSYSQIQIQEIRIQKDKHPKADKSFPTKPDVNLTPGALCERPSELRYPEKIKYCERDVSTDLKYKIIAKYDEELGFAVGSMPRNQFKIDHYIPLCMGGANSPENLWPQHVSVYEQTDRFEQELCVELSHGDITQEEAVAEIKRIKNNIEVFVEDFSYWQQ